MSKIGGSHRVRDELTAALAEGRGVTAKVRWITKLDEEGRNKWIHCTPLIGSNGNIGVWMVVIVDDAKSPSKFTSGARLPPPVADDGRLRTPNRGNVTPSRGPGTPRQNGNGSVVDIDRVTLDGGSVHSLRL
jgi:hypothetical protein